MNKDVYRLVFHRSRALCMVVGELAKGAVKYSLTTACKPRKQPGLVATLKPLVFATWLMAGWVFTAPAAADIVADTRVSGHQLQQVVDTANGIPQVNIRTPNQRGLSHNSYTEFDIDTRGVILNNANTNTLTQQAGMITANPNLVGGTARLILNEVNAPNPSILNGFIEVAGDRADVVVANPAGIICSGCGFINAHRSTLTTGRPQLLNGDLDSFRVTRGANHHRRRWLQ